MDMNTKVFSGLKSIEECAKCESEAVLLLDKAETKKIIYTVTENDLLYCNNFQSKGYLIPGTDNKFMLLKGSKIVKKTSNSCPEHIRKRRKAKNYVENKNCTLKKNTIFDSMSAAAEFVLGCSINGRTAWRKK